MKRTTNYPQGIFSAERAKEGNGLLLLLNEILFDLRDSICPEEYLFVKLQVFPGGGESYS